MSCSHGWKSLFTVLQQISRLLQVWGHYPEPGVPVWFPLRGSRVREIKAFRQQRLHAAVAHYYTCVVMLTFCVANMGQMLCLEVQYHDTVGLLLVLRATLRTLAAKFDQSDSVTFLKLCDPQVLYHFCSNDVWILITVVETDTPKHKTIGSVEPGVNPLAAFSELMARAAGSQGNPWLIGLKSNRWKMTLAQIIVVFLLLF